MVSKKKESQVKHDETKEQLPDYIEVAEPPDGGYGWVVLVAAFFVSFIIDGCMYSFGILLDDIRLYFGATQEKANLISSLNTGFLFCSGPAITGFANQFGHRAVIMAGALVASTMIVLCTFSPNIYFMMITYGVIGGVATGCTYLPSVLMIAMYFSKKRGIATGITMAGSGVGAFVFAPFTKFLLENFDWRMTMIILAAIILQCCVLGALMKPVPIPKRKETVHELKDLNEKGLPTSDIIKEMSESARSLKKEGIDEEDFQRPMYKKDAFYTGSVASLAEYKSSKNEKEYVRRTISVPKLNTENPSCCQRFHLFKVISDIVKEMTDFKLLATNKPFLFIVIANFFVFVGYFLPFIYIPIRAKELNIENYSWILSIIGIVNIPARITFGIIADRKFISALNLNNISFIICTASNLLFFLLLTFWAQTVYAVFFAIGIAGMNTLTSVYLVDLVGLEKLTNANGIMSLFRGFGCFLGPYIGGWISEALKMPVSAFIFSGIMFGVGTILAMLVTIISFVKILRAKTKASKKSKSEKLEKVDDIEADKQLINKV